MVIKLKPAYLETLSVGEHKLTALFEDGAMSAEADFRILTRKDSRAAIPKTGIE